MKYLQMLAATLLVAGSVAHISSGAVVLPDAPEEGWAIVAENLDRILQIDSGFLEGTRAEALEIGLPHRMYYLGLYDIAAGNLLAAARFQHWRYLLFEGSEAVAEVALREDEGAPLRFLSINRGPFAPATTEALERVSNLSQLKDQDYELRGLRISGLHFSALWLYNSDLDDIIIPLPRSFDRYEPFRPYSESELIHILRSEAEDTLKQWNNLRANSTVSSEIKLPDFVKEAQEAAESFEPGDSDPGMLSEVSPGSNLSPETQEAIKARVALGPVTVTELVLLMRPDERAAYLREMASRRLFPVQAPDFFDAVDDEEQIIGFLRQLREPISDEMLAKIEEQLSKEPSDTLLLRYGAILYRYKHPLGLETLTALLERDAEVSHIFALNREQSQEEAVAKALISEADRSLGSDVYISLGRWRSQKVSAALEEVFAVQRKRTGDIAIALALGDNRKFIERFLRLFEEAEPGLRKLFIAAALVRLAPDREENPWLEFLFEEFFAEPEPSLFWVTRALGYTESRRADALLSEILSDTPPDPVRFSSSPDEIKREAILALAHRFSSGEEVQVDWPRVLSEHEHQFRKGERELLVSLLPAETEQADFYTPELADRIRASKLRLLPDNVLPSGIPRE